MQFQVLCDFSQPVHLFSVISLSFSRQNSKLHVNLLKCEIVYFRISRFQDATSLFFIHGLRTLLGGCGVRSLYRKKYWFWCQSSILKGQENQIRLPKIQTGFWNKVYFRTHLTQFLDLKIKNAPISELWGTWLAVSSNSHQVQNTLGNEFSET